jgi:hypothetical protein
LLQWKNRRENAGRRRRPREDRLGGVSADRTDRARHDRGDRRVIEARIGEPCLQGGFGDGTIGCLDGIGRNGATPASAAAIRRPKDVGASTQQNNQEKDKSKPDYSTHGRKLVDHDALRDNLRFYIFEYSGLRQNCHDQVEIAGDGCATLLSHTRILYRYFDICLKPFYHWGVQPT